jgi:xanthine dehydrogenase YagR molybdenum-binding subunit
LAIWALGRRAAANQRSSGIVGVAAAIANAAFHATGVRVRDLPITIDKILGLGRNAAN